MIEPPKEGPPRDFVPALGRAGSTKLYDRVIATMTRERRWRAELLSLVQPSPRDVIVDVGCGTGTFAIMLKRACPGASVVGVDPDPEVLSLAEAKAGAAGVDVAWRRAMGDELSAVVPHSSVTKVVSSLVLHQCPPAMKRAILQAARTILVPGGTLFVADYGEQRSRAMRLLFLLVQLLDGFANTQPNADGVLPRLLAEVGYADVGEHGAIGTPTGTISLLTGRTPAPPRGT